MTRAGALALAALVALPACAAPRRLAAPEGTVPAIWQDRTARLSPVASRPPRAPFTFVEEDRAGVSPKFLVTDADGRRWQVKLGVEAQTEIVAGRLLSVAGYFAEEMYYLPEAKIARLQLTRGREHLRGDGSLVRLRFESRDGRLTRDEPWDWAANPFVGTRELDGLKALMLLINNYDARTANNRIIIVTRPDGVREARYVVADLGASFGRYGGLGGSRSKSDPEGFAATPFITGVRDGQVRFGFSTTPEGFGRVMYVLNPFYTAGQMKKARDLQGLPVASVKWIGDRLRRLDHAALRRMFDEAGYDARTAKAFADVLRARIRAMIEVPEA